MGLHELPFMLAIGMGDGAHIPGASEARAGVLSVSASSHQPPADIAGPVTRQIGDAAIASKVVDASSMPQSSSDALAMHRSDVIIVTTGRSSSPQICNAHHSEPSEDITHRGGRDRSNNLGVNSDMQRLPGGLRAELIQIHSKTGEASHSVWDCSLVSAQGYHIRDDIAAFMDSDDSGTVCRSSLKVVQERLLLCKDHKGETFVLGDCLLRDITRVIGVRKAAKTVRIYLAAQISACDSHYSQPPCWTVKFQGTQEVRQFISKMQTSCQGKVQVGVL